MMKNVELCGYDVCTPIQSYCIPAILGGYDVFASAQTGSYFPSIRSGAKIKSWRGQITRECWTDCLPPGGDGLGSGKTAAFLVPVLSKLMGKAKTLAAPRPNPVTFNLATDYVRAEPLVIIVSPTRELATQIFDEARRFCYRSMLRPSVIYGGAPIGEQIADLRRGCDVLIGTPGRLCDMMDRSNILSLRRVRYRASVLPLLLSPSFSLSLSLNGLAMGDHR